MKLKKLMCLLLTGCLVFSLASCGGSNADDVPEDISTTPDSTVDQTEPENENDSHSNSLKYVIPEEADFTVEDADDGVKITKYTGTETAVEIPAQIGEKDVIAIDSSAFANTAVVGIKLPDTVVTVADKAFYYCPSLAEISLGANVETIGESAFEGCTLLSSVHLNEHLKSIGNRAFSVCYALKGIDLPSGLQEIGDIAFGMCELEQITIPGSVQTIGMQAFTSCVNLTEVVLEDGVKYIGDGAFDGCIALKTAELPASLEEIGWDAFVNSKQITIYGAAGSLAETYASEFGHAFEPI